MLKDSIKPFRMVGANYYKQAKRGNYQKARVTYLHSLRSVQLQVLSSWKSMQLPSHASPVRLLKQLIENLQKVDFTDINEHAHVLEKQSSRIGHSFQVFESCVCKNT